MGADENTENRVAEPLLDPNDDRFTIPSDFAKIPSPFALLFP